MNVDQLEDTSHQERIDKVGHAISSAKTTVAVNASLDVFMAPKADQRALADNLLSELGSSTSSVSLPPSVLERLTALTHSGQF